MDKPFPTKTTIDLSGKPRETVHNVFFKWAIHVGRIIIVATELIALAALLYRFYVDRQIIDLHDQIKREEILVRQQEAKEKEYRNIQQRLSYVKTISEESAAKVTVMNFIVSTTKSGSFQTTNLVANQNIISLDGNAFSIFSINNFIDALRKNPAVTSISLDEISGTEQGIKFKLKIILKEDTTT